MLLLKNGYVINPADGTEGYRDILVQDGVITEIAETIEEDGAECIDAYGCVVAPGLVDVHVHFRDPGFLYKEDILTGAAAAAKGGFTAVVLMANTKPAVDNVETLSYILDKGRQTGIRVETCANVTLGMQGRETVDMSKLRKAGAAGFTDDGIPILDEEILRKAMKESAALQVPISLHEENPAYIKQNGINSGIAVTHFGIGGSDREAEIFMVKRDLQIAIETGAIVNIQHISTKEAVQLVREAKKSSDRIHAEAAPHHFTLTEDALKEYGTLAKMNPPLRTEEDRLAVIEGLCDGTIDLIATDHAPHSEEEKKRPLTEAPSGIIGLETALPLGITELVRTGKLTMCTLLERMSTAPARLYGLPGGCIRKGAAADLIVFRADETARAGNYVSKSSNSPFTGRELYGVVKYTICRGKIVYEQK